MIEVVGDASKLDKTFKQAATSTNKFGRSLDGLSAGRSARGIGSLSALAKGGAITVGLGVAAQQMTKLTAAASDTNEELSKSTVIFGDASREVDQFSRKTASALGIARVDALRAASDFGGLFQTVGVGQREAAKLSQQFVQLGGDLSSFFNTSTEDSLLALRSALVGESEPIRRFNVLLNEAAVQQEAFRQTGKRSATELTNQDKVLARVSIIMAQTAKAQGDAARTGGNLAGQQRKLNAELKDTQAQIGQQLLPLQLKLTEALRDGIGAAHGFASAIGDINAKLDDLNLGFLNQGLVDLIPDHSGIDAAIKSIVAMREAVKQTDDEAKKLRETLEGLGAIDLNPGNVTDVAAAVAAARASAEKKKPPSFGEPGFKPGKAPPVPTGPTAEQRNRFFDDALRRKEDRVQDISSLAGQIAELRKIEALIEQRIAVTKDITRRLNLEDELAQVRRQRKSVEQQATEAARQARDDAAALRKQRIEEAKVLAEKRAQAAQAAVQAKQFRAIGLSAQGGDVVPGVENLRKQLASLSSRPDIDKASSKLRSQLTGVRKVLSGELGKATEETRSRIQELFATIRQELAHGKTDAGPLTKTTQLNTKKILAGLGLSPADERQLRSRLSVFNSAGTRLAGTSGQRPVAVSVSSPDVFIDRQKVSTAVRRENTVHARRNPKQKRGSRF